MKLEDMQTFRSINNMMSYISESILDDINGGEIHAASAIQQEYATTIHPSEYQYCLMVVWDDRVEDILSVYTKRFSIYRLNCEEDVRRISTLITFNLSYSPERSSED